MRVQTYLLNRTHIAEDLSTGLVAYADSQPEAIQKLTALVAEYWEKKKVIVPINSNKDERVKEIQNGA